MMRCSEQKLARIDRVYKGPDPVYDVLVSASGSLKLKVMRHKIGKITENGLQSFKRVNLPQGEII